MTGETEPMSLDVRLERLEDQVGHLIHLVRTGGKDSRVTEVVLEWTANQADGECEFTGCAVPTKNLVKHRSIKVHPGVAAFAEERGIEDLTKVPETVVPDDYLVTPHRIEFREVYRPPTRVVWEKEQIVTFTRPAMMYLCGQLHVQQKLEERGIGPREADFRRQTNGWLRECLCALVDGKDVPDPLPIGTVKPGRKAKPKKDKPDETPVETPTAASEGSEPKNEVAEVSTKTRTSPSKGKKASKSKTKTSSPTAKSGKKSSSKSSATSPAKPKKSSAKKTAKKSGGSKVKPKAGASFKTGSGSKPTKTRSESPRSSSTKPIKAEGTTKMVGGGTKGSTKSSEKKVGKKKAAKKAAKKSPPNRPSTPKKKTAKKKGSKK